MNGELCHPRHSFRPVKRKKEGTLSRASDGISVAKSEVRHNEKERKAKSEREGRKEREKRREG